MTDYDARQFNLMIERLDAFRAKTTNLGRLVSDLDGLLSTLEGVDARWKDAFQRQWGVLEDVYADLLDRNLEEISDQYMDLLREAMKEMRRLISEQLS